MFKQIAVAATLLIASSSSFAQQAPQFYAGADVGSSKFDGSDSETGAGVFVGYKINENFAVEAGYHRLAKSDASYYDSEYRVNAEGTAKANQIDISVIGTIPLSSGFSLFGRLGYNRIELKGDVTVSGGGMSVRESFSENEDKVLYGAGLAYAFTPTIAGRLEVQKPSSDITRVAVGVAFGF